MRRPGRNELYREICTRVGITPTTGLRIGYFPRKELLELLMYLEHVDKLLKQIEALKNHPVIKKSIEAGNISWPTGMKD